MNLVFNWFMSMVLILLIFGKIALIGGYYSIHCKVIFCLKVIIEHVGIGIIISDYIFCFKWLFVHELFFFLKSDMDSIITCLVN